MNGIKINDKNASTAWLALSICESAAFRDRSRREIQRASEVILYLVPGNTDDLIHYFKIDPLHGCVLLLLCQLVSHDNLQDVFSCRGFRAQSDMSARSQSLQIRLRPRIIRRLFTFIDELAFVKQLQLRRQLRTLGHA